MQVHSFDQLLDGLITGSVVSHYLLTDEFQCYVNDLVLRIKNLNVGKLLTTKLCLAFWLLHVAYLACYFGLDHQLTAIQIQTARKTCDFDLAGFEPVNHTFGVMLYTFAFLGALIGLWLCNDSGRYARDVFSPKEFANLFVRLLPCWPLILISELSWHGYPLAIKLLVKYLLPPFLTNVYLFGYSHRLIK